MMKQALGFSSLKSVISCSSDAFEVENACGTFLTKPEGAFLS